MLFWILRLDFESRGQATGSARTVAVRGAVRGHKAEGVAVAVIRRPLPPSGRRTRSRMPVLHLRVSRRIIGVLRLLILFILVCIAPRTENFELSQKRKIIDRFGYICSHVRTVALVIRVLCHWLHYGPQVAWERRHKCISHRAGRCVGGRIISNRAGSLLSPISTRRFVSASKNVIPHIARSPAAIVCIVVARCAPMVHLEILRAVIALVLIVVTINKAYICAAR